jgi:hypothetical protein
MKKRTASILVTAALAAPVSGCVFGTEGELKSGSFYYECPANQFDSACAGSGISLAAIPTFVAVGATFGMQFQKNGTADPSYSPVAASPDLVAAVPGGAAGSPRFRFTRPGYGAILARDTVGNVADFVHLQAAAPDHIDILRETIKLTELSVPVGSKTVIKIQPKDSAEHPLAGGLDLEWSQSGDGSVVKLDNAPGFSSSVSQGIQITALAPGKVDVTAKAGGLSAVVHVTVTGGTP